MRYFSRILWLGLLLLLLSACAPPFAPSAAVQLANVTIDKVTINSQALAGNLLGDPAERNVVVLLPPSYATSDRRYPVIYMLHGYDSDEAYANDLVPSLQAALRNGSVQEMIVVVPDASNRLGGSWYLSSPTIGDYETYITKELVAFVDGRYRTLDQRESRGIGGCSMGGDGSIRLALKYPEVYSVAAPISGRYDYYEPAWLEETARDVSELPADDASFKRLPAGPRIEISTAAGVAPNPNQPPFFLDMPYARVDGKIRAVPGFAEKFAAASPRHELEHYLQQPVRLKDILLYHAADDDIVSIWRARTFDRQMTAQGVPHTYLELPTGGHCPSDSGPVWQFMSGNLSFSPVSK